MTVSTIAAEIAAAAYQNRVAMARLRGQPIPPPPSPEPAPAHQPTPATAADHVYQGRVISAQLNGAPVPPRPAPVAAPAPGLTPTRQVQCEAAASGATADPADGRSPLQRALEVAARLAEGHVSRDTPAYLAWDPEGIDPQTGRAYSEGPLLRPAGSFVDPHGR